ncbi:hypothetical protein AQUSIP_06970 [Aquicella siphonis]|uniref:Uncharacterized protein n=1 Tax=Aquicella siphonis TaxID=254247 RepID=A0A5E4PG35_9COXI|nr:hypothetical protein [Aquicella siphonis]VVC75407.1 hypothetical protein AQUSIP_06970 [Aquicella siphonis]
MHKKIILFVACTSFAFHSSLLFADLMDDDGIIYIHSKTKSSSFQMCKDKMIGATDNVCTCLADSASAKIDDNELKKCDIKDSKCISKAIEFAVLNAFSQEGIKACVRQSEGK